MASLQNLLIEFVILLCAESGKLTCLSRKNRAVKYPRFNQDGSRLVWFEIPAGGPHGQCCELLSLDWTAYSDAPVTKVAPEVIIPLIARPTEKANGFPGKIFATVSSSGIDNLYLARKFLLLFLELATPCSKIRSQLMKFASIYDACVD